MSLDDAARAALDIEVRLGTLLADIPALRHGRADTVAVTIGRGEHAELAARALLGPSSEPSVSEALKTAAVMGVDLHGSAFDIRSLTPDGSEQLVVPAARWDFSVTPRRSGPQSLTVVAWMRIAVPNHGEKPMALPSLTHTVQVEVDRLYAANAFLRANWQFVVTTIVAIAGVVVAMIALH